MREFLLAACPVLLWCIVAFHVVFLFLLGKGQKKQTILFHLSWFITFGLFYDALVLALGCFLPAESLRAVSQARFISHGVLIPLIFPICAYALKWKGIPLRITWIFTAVLMALGAAEGACVQLEVREVAGIVRFASSDATPAWADAVSSILSYGTVIPLIIAGIFVWIKQKTPTLFLSGFLMFAFAALGPATGNFDLIFFISMFGEVLMVLFFYLYARHALKA